MGSLRQTPATFLTAGGGVQMLADHFLTRFADAYLAEVRDFVQNILNERSVQVTGEDGLSTSRSSTTVSRMEARLARKLV